MDKRMNRWKRALLYMGLMMLSACGGGGDDGTSPQPGTEPKAALTMDQARVLVGRVGALWGVANTTIEVSKRMLDNFNASGSYDVTGHCQIDGQARNAYRDVDGNRTLSTGDELTVEAFRCKEYSAGVAKVESNGQVKLAVRQAEGVQRNYFESFFPWRFAARHTYASLVSTTSDQISELNGSMDTDHSNEGATLRFDNFARTTETTQKVAFQVLSGEFRLEYANHVGKPSYKSATYVGLDMRTNLGDQPDFPFTSWGAMTLRGDGVVLSGQLRISAGNDKVLVTVLGPDQVRIDLDRGGDGTADASFSGLWSAIGNEAIF